VAVEWRKEKKPMGNKDMNEYWEKTRKRAKDEEKASNLGRSPLRMTRLVPLLPTIRA